MKDNLGGSVQEKDGAITTTLKGKSLHIEGTATTHPMSYMTYFTTLSMDIDDVSLIENHKAAITQLDMVTDTETSYGSTTEKGKAHLTAANIPMDNDYAGYKCWKGKGITGYSWNSTTYYTDKTVTNSMSLVDNAENSLVIWIQFKNGTKAQAVARFR